MTSSYQKERLSVTTLSTRSPDSRASTPLSTQARSPSTDDALWIRLHEAGFDEESIKRRDKAALIAYIAKLESEMVAFHLLMSRWQL